MIQSRTVNGIKFSYAIARPNIDKVYSESTFKRSVKEIGVASKADAALNFNFAEYTVTGKPIGRLVVGGKVVVSNIAKTVPRDEIYILPNGTWGIGKAPSNAVSSMQGSPRVLRNGKKFYKESVKRDQLDSSAWAGKNYRTCVGIKADGSLVGIRTKTKITMEQLEDLMLALDCIDALNGDGGGSSYFWPDDNGWGRDLGAALCFEKGEEPKVEIMTNGLTIYQDFIPKGRGNRPAHPMVAEYITIHETENKSEGADAWNHASYLSVNPKSASAPVSWHFTTDDHEAVQHLPINESAYHAGDGATGSGNRKSVGIEICENSDGDFEKAMENGAKVAAYLMLTLNLPISRVVQHNKWSGKNCPNTIRNSKEGWAGFIAKVQKHYNALTVLPDETEPVVPVRGFEDLDGHWALNEILPWIDAGLMNGMSAVEFGPDKPMTRAQFCVMMNRMGFKPAPKEVK